MGPASCSSVRVVGTGHNVPPRRVLWQPRLRPRQPT